MNRKILIVQLPFLLDNPIAIRLNFHPLRDVEWEYLGGSIYLVRLPINQVSEFRSRLRKGRWFNIADLFGNLLLFEFDSESGAQNFLDEFLPK